MLPNWLLGKSKSKLQEILGGGGGGGTDYTAGDGIDISDGVISFDPATTPAIDPSKIDGLDDDLTALTPKSAISNPNILHNPWFQVNQRGTASAITSDVFIVDRWKTNIISGASGTFTVNSDGTITIASTSNTISMYQKRTAKTFTRLKGRKVTLSVMLADGTIYSGTGVVPSSGIIHVFNNDDISIGLDETEDKLFILHVFEGKTITIKALKFEVGEISTLAMDTAPDMATELAKCQRYFQRISGDEGSIIDWGVTAAGTSGPIRYCIHIKEMRAKPTMSYSNVRCGASTPTGFSLIGYTSGRVQVDATLTASLTPDIPYRLLFASGGYIDFNAEL